MAVENARDEACGVKLGGDRGNPSKVARQGYIAGLATRQERAARRAADLRPIIAGIRASGIESLNGIAAELNRREIPTARGSMWSAVQVGRVLERVA